MPRYEVRTIEWLRYEDPGRPHKSRVPIVNVVWTHFNYADAVATCDAANAEAWAAPAFNPFHYGGESLFFQSTFPPGPFCDYLQDRGLDLPDSGPDTDNAGWVTWYTLHRPKFAASQLTALREAMNLVRFAEVVELPDPAAKGYVVQELNWSWNDQNTLDADGEGGNFVAVYRSRARAEERCATLNAARQALPEYEGFAEFSTEGRRGAVEPLETPIAETVFYEVVEIDLGGPGAEVTRE